MGSLVQVQLKTLLDLNFKLYVKCILSNQNYSFLNNLSQNLKHDNILINNKSFYMLVLHFRFSSLFYSSQLVDILSYELPNYISSRNKGMQSIIVYNFHVLNTQNRFFIFLNNASISNSDHSLNYNTSMTQSIVELYYASN